MAFDLKTLTQQREAKGWSQSALARKAAVSRSVVSHWETGRGVPDEAQSQRLAALFPAEAPKSAAAARPAPAAKPAPASKAAPAAKPVPASKPAPAAKKAPARAPETVAAWLSQQRQGARLAVEALAKQTGLRTSTVGSIEDGKAPWPRKRTRKKLEKVLGALPALTAARAKERARVDGFGVLTDFNPHDPEDHPKTGGVFVLYDGASRPVYVGQSKSVRKRVEGLAAEAWFKAPTVEQAAFLEVEEKPLREALESLLVRTLRGALLVRTRHASE
jgi:ribosome-binding protein aMBF1 (putative translation factor)